MAELKLKSQRFRQEREADWVRLETLLGRMERSSPARLSDDELLALPVLYRACLSSLSVARATSLDLSLIEYLESLCSRAYFIVYSARATLPERLGRFFRVEWPEQPIRRDPPTYHARRGLRTSRANLRRVRQSSRYLR